MSPNKEVKLVLLLEVVGGATLLLLVTDNPTNILAVVCSCDVDTYNTHTSYISYFLSRLDPHSKSTTLVHQLFGGYFHSQGEKLY